MKAKESYTFEELCTSLKMPMSKFCQMAGVTEGTIARLRKGYSARRGTINTLLDTFSQVYGIDFSLENVTGLTPIEKPITPIAEKAIELSVSPSSVADIHKEEAVQIRNVALSEGTMSLKEFADASGIPLRTLHNWKDTGKIETTHRDRSHGGGIEILISPEEQKKALERNAMRTPRKSKDK